MSIRCIMVVHVYGRIVNMDLVHRFAKRYGLFVIEDMAEAHGALPHPETHAVCHSFYRNKIIAGAEGGAVWFRDPTHAVKARRLRSLGFTEEHDFMHIPRGHNYRMSTVHAELVRVSLKQYGDNLARRREYESWYDEMCPAQWKQPKRDVPWVYDIRIPEMSTIQQSIIVKTLRERYGVEARHAFKPMHVQPEFFGCRRVGGDVAEKASREVIYLPLTPGSVTRETVRTVFDVIGKCLEKT